MKTRMTPPVWLDEYKGKWVFLWWGVLAGPVGTSCSRVESPEDWDELLCVLNGRLAEYVGEEPTGGFLLLHDKDECEDLCKRWTGVPVERFVKWFENV